MMPKPKTIGRLKIALFIVLLIPFIVAAAQVILGKAGANPIEYILHNSGEWALRILLFTLAITPIRRLTNQNWVIRFRRMLGVYAFFYAAVHFTIYTVLDQGLSILDVWDDIISRPYILVGFVSLLIMLPLAITSTNGMMKRLGKNWAKLHKLVYVSAIAAVGHFFWMKLSKSDYQEPLVYAAILAGLFVFRIYYNYKTKKNP